MPSATVCGAALRPDDAGRARGRAPAGLAPLQDHDAFRAALPGEHRGPPADRAGAHDDEVGGLPVRHASLLPRRAKSR